jgi:hypothetical protein
MPGSFGTTATDDGVAASTVSSANSGVYENNQSGDPLPAGRPVEPVFWASQFHRVQLGCSVPATIPPRSSECRETAPRLESAATARQESGCWRTATRGFSR